MWRALAHRKKFGSKELDRILITLGERAAQFFGLFGASEGRIRFSLARSVPDAARRSLSRRAGARWKWSRCNWSCCEPRRRKPFRW